MDIDLLSTPRARLTRDGDGMIWCRLRGLVTKRFRVMPEKPLTLQHAAGLLSLTVVELCELMDNDATLMRVSEIRMAHVSTARKTGG